MYSTLHQSELGNKTSLPHRPVPRSAGFWPHPPWPHNGLREYLDSRNVNQLRTWLFELEGRANNDTQSRGITMLDDNGKAGSRKPTRNKPFFDRLSPWQARKVLRPRAKSRTPNMLPDNRKYRQIITAQVYDGLNASTYQVNSNIKQARTSRDGKGEKELASPRKEHGVASGNGQGNGHQQKPSTSIGHTHNETQMETIPARKEDFEVFQPSIERPDTISPIASSEEVFPGIESDFSRILLREDSTNRMSGTFRTPASRSGSQPSVRDFAIGLARAVRRRSCSPIKRAETREVARRQDPQRRIIKEPAALPAKSGSLDLSHPDNAVHPPVPKVFTTKESESSIKHSAAFLNHSKPRSVISAESTAEDIHSNASSPVVSNAQRAIFVQARDAPGLYSGHSGMPPLASPAPVRALPSLPESQATVISGDPRHGESSQRAIPERSPIRSPPKLPGRKYRLTPNSTSPTKRLASPERTSTESQRKHIFSQSRSTVWTDTEHTNALGSEAVPLSTSSSALNKRHRRETATTKNLKLQNVEGVKFDQTIFEQMKPASPRTPRTEAHHQGIVMLPCSRDSYEEKPSSTGKKLHNSLVSELSTSMTLQQSESRSLYQKISPITVVAEQQPIPREQHVPIQIAQTNEHSIHELNGDIKANKTHLLAPIDTSSSLPLSDPPNGQRPHSSPPLPSYRFSAAHVPMVLPCCRHAPSQQSNKRSSLSEPDLEARLSAIERKNVLLERVLLAILNTPALLDSHAQMGMQNSENRSSGVSGKVSLYAEPDNWSTANCNVMRKMSEG